MGTPHGAVISPLLENIYLHCVFDLWVEARREKHARGDVIVVRYAFLGFAHISGKNRKGYFIVKRRTMAKRLRAKLQEIKLPLRQRRHAPIAETGKWLRSVVQGYFNDHAVAGNLDRLGTFRHRLVRLWRSQLRQRSQRTRCNWERMNRLVARWVPKPYVLHPWPVPRFAARHPR